MSIIAHPIQMIIKSSLISSIVRKQVQVEDAGLEKLMVSNMYAFKRETLNNIRNILDYITQPIYTLFII